MEESQLFLLVIRNLLLYLDEESSIAPALFISRHFKDEIEHFEGNHLCPPWVINLTDKTWFEIRGFQKGEKRAGASELYRIIKNGKHW